MPYFFLGIAQVWWFLQSILIFHLKLASEYLHGWSVLVEGDRIVSLYSDRCTYTEYHKDRMSTNLLADSDEEDDELTADWGEDDGLTA